LGFGYCPPIRYDWGHMKRALTILLGCLFIGFGGTSLSAVEAYEGFDYEVGLLGNSNGGSGWESDYGWGRFPRGNGISNGIGGSSSNVVVSDSLIPPADYGLPTLGGAVKGTADFQFAHREFATENYIDLDNGNPVYFSFLFSMDAITSGSGSYTHLLLINSDRTNLIRFGVGTGSLTAGIFDGADPTSSLSSDSEALVPGTSYLMVVKIVPGVDEDVFYASLYGWNESIGTEPESWEMETTQDFPFAMVDRIGLLLGGVDEGSTIGTIDEIRFGDSFESVTGVSSGTPPWAGYPVSEVGDVDTGGFMGYVNVLYAPWVWSYSLTKFVYVKEEAVTESGAWTYVPR